MRHEVFLADRGGQEEKIVAKLDGESLVKWNRVRDDVSEAEVALEGISKECHSELDREGLEMRFELVIKRDGERVWEGPITRSHVTRSSARIFCRDVLLFTQRTPCLNKWTSAFGHGGPEFVTARTLRIIKGEMAIWEAAGANFIPHIVVRQNAKTAKTTRVAEKYSQYVWDDMEELASRSGMDYTVANRSLYLFDTHQFLGQGRRLSDDDFLADLEVVGYGLELAVRSLVTDSLGHGAVTTSPDDYYGPFGLLATAYNVNTTTERIPHSELVEQATRNARSRYPVPVVLRVPENAQVRPDKVDDLLPYLIPGTGFPISSEISTRVSDQVQKLDNVTFEETEAAGEVCRVTLSAAPVGSGVEGVEDGG